jgi:hypothetical protein
MYINTNICIYICIYIYIYIIIDLYIYILLLITYSAPTGGFTYNLAPYIRSSNTDNER